MLLPVSVGPQTRASSESDDRHTIHLNYACSEWVFLCPSASFFYFWVPDSIVKKLETVLNSSAPPKNNTNLSGMPLGPVAWFGI